MDLSKTNIGYGLMVFGSIVGPVAPIILGHSFGDSDIGYYAAMTYALLLIGIGGVITDSKAAMAFGSLALMGEAFIIWTYIMRLGMIGGL